MTQQLSNSTLKKIISNVRLFHNFTIKEIAWFLSMGERHTFKKNTVIIQEGRFSREFFIVLQGELEVFKKDNHKKQVLNTIKEMNILGEIGVVLNSKRTASIMCREDSILLSYDRNFLTEIEKKKPNMAAKLFRNFIDVLINSYLLPKESKLGFLSKKLKQLHKNHTIPQEFEIRDAKNHWEKKFSEKIQNFNVKKKQDKQSILKLRYCVHSDIFFRATFYDIINNAFQFETRIETFEEVLRRLDPISIKFIISLLNLIKYSPYYNDYKTSVNNFFNFYTAVNKYFLFFYYTKYNKKTSSYYNISGLVFDIGILVQKLYFPKTHDKINKYANKHKLTFFEAEDKMEVYDKSHNILGALFLDFLKMPDFFIELSKWHHNNDKISKEYKKLIQPLIKVNNLVSCIKGSESIKDLSKCENPLPIMTSEEKVKAYKDIKNSLMSD